MSVPWVSAQKVVKFPDAPQAKHVYCPVCRLTEKLLSLSSWKAGYAAIVEGESDTQTLLYMNIPVLGVAGASLFKEGQAAMLQDLKLYLHKEPDRGGDTFLTKMTTRLRMVVS